MKPLTIITDTREQNPYLFSNIDPKPNVIHKGLPTGDYTLQGYESQIIIERKSKGDLFGSFGQGRDRLRREFARLSEFDYAALVIECSLSDIFVKPPPYTKMNPKSIFRTLLSWSVRYNVHAWTPPDRVFAEKLTYILLAQYFRHHPPKEV